MTRTEIIIKEMKKSSSWTRYLLKSFDQEKELIIPEGLKTNVNWQIGHILLSRHYHSVVMVFGKQKALTEAIPFREYAAHYAMGSKAAENGTKQPSIALLMDGLREVDKVAVELISEMSESSLDEELLREHPVAKTKYDSLMWSGQHQMWHNGQLALIKNLL
jgi:hypothetical protein